MNIIKELFREKNINAPCAGQPLKIQSERLPTLPRQRIEIGGKLQDVGHPDGGIEGDRFIEQFRNDPPTH